MKTINSTDNQLLHHFVTFLQTHSFIIPIVIGCISIVTMILMGILIFFKEEIKKHRTNKKLVSEDSKREAEIRKALMETDIFKGLISSINNNSTYNNNNNRNSSQITTPDVIHKSQERVKL